MAAANKSNWVKKPVTETPNEITKNIDLMSPVGMLKLLRQSDSQLWNGYADLECVYDLQLMNTLMQAIEVCTEVLRHSNGENN